MRLRAKGAGVRFVEDYRTDQLIDDVQYLTKGFTQYEGNFWEPIEDVNSISLAGKTHHLIDQNHLELPYINQYLLDSDTDFRRARY